MKEISRRRFLAVTASLFLATGLDLVGCGEGKSKEQTPPLGNGGDNNPPLSQVEFPKPTPTIATVEGISPDYQKFWTRYPEGTEMFDFEAVDSSGRTRRISEFADSPTILVINCMDGNGQFTQKLLRIFDRQLQKYSAGGLKAVFVEIPQLGCSADWRSPSDFFRVIVQNEFPKTQIEVWIGDRDYLESFGPKINHWRYPDSNEFTFYELKKKGVPAIYYLDPGLELKAEYIGAFDQEIFDQATAKFMKGK